jgi:integrase
MSKCPHGTVQVKSSNNRLQLVFTYSGRRIYLSLRLPDSKQNRNYAEMQARQIQNDILAGHFNPNQLDKYTPQKAASKKAEVAEIVSLRDLWERYSQYKSNQLAQSTIAKDFDRYANHIDRFPSDSIRDAVAIRDHLLQTTTPNAAKRVLTNLGAACNWAVRSNLILVNPFIGMAADIRATKDGGRGIDPFTADERDLVIETFKERDPYYAPLVELLFRVGCRPSEAIGLQYRCIGTDCESITFEQSVTPSEFGLKLEAGTKTQDRRVFPCGANLRDFLRSIVPSNRDPTAFVFTGVKGGFVNWNKFSSGHWKPVMAALNLGDRTPYQTRHTFITLALESGLDAKDVAALVGNSPEIIYRHYAGAKKTIVAPDF